MAGCTAWGLRSSGLRSVGAPKGLALVPGYSALWLFNEGAGTVLTDYSGSGNHGTLASGANAPAWAASGLTFDGGDYVTVPETLAGATACTVLVAMNVTSTTATAGYFSTAGNDGTNGDYTLSIRRGGAGNDNLNVRASDGTNRAGIDTSGTAENGGTATYRTALVRYIGGVSLEGGYVAGAAAKTTTSVPASLNATPAAAATIGRHATFYLTGGVAAILVYRSALTDAQIAQDQKYLKAIMAARGVALS